MPQEQYENAWKNELFVIDRLNLMISKCISTGLNDYERLKLRIFAPKINRILPIRLAVFGVVLLKNFIEIFGKSGGKKQETSYI